MKHMAVVGCGRVVERFYLPALRGSADWRLVAAVDPHPGRRDWIGRVLPGTATYATLAEVPADTPLDAVLIASPPASHGPMTVEALRRGMHVFLEKPMAPTAAEAWALVELARQCRRQLLIGFNRRFRLSYGMLRDRLRRLPQGRVVSIDYHLCSDAACWQPVSSYLGSEEEGGGVLDDIASHQLDLLPWLLDSSAVAVSASRASGTTSDAAVNIRLRLVDGREASCHAAHDAASVERLEIVLDRGVLLATRGGVTHSRGLPIGAARACAGMRDLSIGAARRLAGRPNVTVDSFRRQLAEWARIVDGDARRPATSADGAAGARCVDLIEACRASLARHGAWVTPDAPARQEV